MVVALSNFTRLSRGMLKLGLIVTAIFASQLPACAREAGSQPIDLRRAQLVIPSDLSGPENKAVELLVEEIQARMRLRLNVNTAWPRNAAVPVMALGPVTSLKNFAGRHADEFAGEQQLPPEGYRIRTIAADERAPAAVIVGNDSRGVLFGVGHLLRSLAMSRDRLELPAPLDVTTAPFMPIRGHQLGYRPKTNSYDAWDLAQWEQYIRDLVVFGCNAIELIPPRSDDAADSPHFARPPCGDHGVSSPRTSKT